MFGLVLAIREQNDACFGRLGTLLNILVFMLVLRNCVNVSLIDFVTS